MRKIGIFLSLICGVLAWHYLSTWYVDRDGSNYIAFAIFALIAFLSAFWPYLKVLRHKLTAKGWLLLTGTILLCLPWAEWSTTVHMDSRKPWTRQVFLELLFVYAVLLLFRYIPRISEVITSKTVHLLDLCGKNRFLLWCPAILFFVFCTLINSFIFLSVPAFQDSAAHIFQSKIFAHLQLSAPIPPHPEFFSVFGDMLVMANGRWFSMYQPGFALLLAPFLSLHAQWLLCPLLGALTIAIWLHYLRKYHGIRPAVLFGWLALFSPFLLLMSSTVMVFTPELFLASCVLVLCRRQTEKASWGGSILLALALLYVMLVRSFSSLPFLLPILIYTLWKGWTNRSFSCVLAILSGIVLGTLLLCFFQLHTTGDPFVPGYSLEYPKLRLGFGTNGTYTHTPARGLVNISNNFLGLNDWLTGWYSGSLLFVLLFLVTKTNKDTWDRLLMTGCCLLALFYFGFVFQDLVIGPRYFYPMAAFLLSLIARSPWQSKEKTRKTVLALIVVGLFTFFPQQFWHYLSPFRMEYKYPGQLKSALKRNQGEKLIVFLKEEVPAYFTDWNEPFLDGPVIFSRDLHSRNILLQKSFPDYQPVYFGRASATNTFTPGTYQFEDSRNSGQVTFSFYQVALNMEAARHQAEVDLFDVCYTDPAITSNAESNLAFIMNRLAGPSGGAKPRDRFREGLVYTSLALMLPFAAFQENGLQWQKTFSNEAFRDALHRAEAGFRECGDIGETGLKTIEKVNRRIDKDRNGILDDLEIQQYFDIQFSRIHLQ